MYEDLIRASGRVKEPKEHAINFGPFNGGLVTSRPPHMLARNECTQMTNLVIGTDGIPKTRPGITQVAASTSSLLPQQIGDVRVNGTWYLIVSSSIATHQLFYVTALGAFVQIGNNTSFSGPISFIGFNDLLIIFDGSYVKYWDGTDVELLYDGGTGNKPSAEVLLRNLNGEVNEQGLYLFTPIQSDVTSKQAVKFTTPDINTNFELPPIAISLKMARVGTGSEVFGTAVKGVLRNSSTYASLASKDICLPENLPEVDAPPSRTDESLYEQIDVEFTADDVTLSADTAYLFSVEFDDGSTAAANYPAVLFSLSSTLDATIYYYDEVTSGWYAAINKLMAADILCTTPPKIEAGVVHNSRIMGIEGEDGTNPDYVWYSGAGNHLDWSSENYAGYLSSGISISAIASFYGSLLLFGGEKNPSLKRMTGSEPAAYAMTDSIQEVSASQKSLVATSNDLMFLHASGVSSINTMREFGDIRAINRGDNIKPDIIDHYNSDAMAAYEPRYGLYLLKLDDNETTSLYAVHTRGASRSVISKWTLGLPPSAVAITCMNQGESGVYIGAEPGIVFKIDYTTLKDGGTYPSYSIKSRVFLSQHMNLTAARYYAMLSSNGNGGSVDFKLYRNQSTTALQSETITLPTDLSGAQPDSGAAYLRAFGRKRLNFDFWALQVSFENIVPVSDNPIYFGDIQVLAR